MSQNNKKTLTPLCKIAYKYGTDKCPQIKHNFTPYYYKLLNKKRQEVLKVLEMGIGNYKDMIHVNSVYDPGLNRTYKKGASLKMWRDFFQNAIIYGADYVPETMFKAKRIKTYLCDERSVEDIKNLINKTGSNIDLFIDDASHKKEDQVFLANNILPLLNKNIIYIIEDVTYPDYIKKNLSDYKCKVIECSKRWKDDKLVIVNNKTA